MSKSLLLTQIHVFPNGVWLQSYSMEKYAELKYFNGIIFDVNDCEQPDMIDLVKVYKVFESTFI